MQKTCLSCNKTTDIPNTEHEKGVSSGLCKGECVRSYERWIRGGTGMTLPEYHRSRTHERSAVAV